MWLDTKTTSINMILIPQAHLKYTLEIFNYIYSTVTADVYE